MGKQTSIPFADHSWNGWLGCTRLDDACQDCYAAAFSNRLGMDLWSPGSARRTLSDAHWAEPLSWNNAAAAKGRMASVFGFSMADIFDNRGPEGERARFFRLVRETPNLFWILFTRRPQLFERYLPEDWGTGYRNVMLVVSAHDLEHAEQRIPILQATPAAYRGISLEPLKQNWLPAYFADRGLAGIDWLMLGGQAKQPGMTEAWSFDLDWARSAIGLGRGLGISVFIKQLGSCPVDQGRRLKLCHLRGEDTAEWPSDIRVRERIDPTAQPRRSATAGLPATADRVAAVAGN